MGGGDGERTVKWFIPPNAAISSCRATPARRGASAAPPLRRRDCGLNEGREVESPRLPSSAASRRPPTSRSPDAGSVVRAWCWSGRGSDARRSRGLPVAAYIVSQTMRVASGRPCAARPTLIPRGGAPAVRFGRGLVCLPSFPIIAAGLGAHDVCVGGCWWAYRRRGSPTAGARARDCGFPATAGGAGGTVAVPWQADARRRVSGKVSIITANSSVSVLLSQRDTGAG